VFGLPTDTDLGFLQGEELIQVCFAQYQVQLHFYNARLAIESKYCLRESDSSVEQIYERDRVAEGHALVPLLGQSIRIARVVANGVLELEFGTGVILTVYDDSEQYESYTIKYKNGLIVI
jgi:hypothetical protein